LSANQLEFINLIVNHLTEHGAMEPDRLYESPFTDLTPRGPDGLFQPAELDELMHSRHDCTASRDEICRVRIARAMSTADHRHISGGNE
jgi:type I restriction enzyme R subunit